ncbi:TIGR03086 family metal-binding protein [Phytomonospora sp. NPDC050363]|uniref:TIGR03086 family metal-binding protein n=1 Tax=Phytomonospora sp. NPDC050363 TaxID=3155642 RepID=UPI0033C02366
MSEFADSYVTESDPLAAHARLVDTVGALVHSATPEQLDDPTPCGDWTVRQVIAHLTDTNDEYATLAATGDMPTEHPTYGDPVAAFDGHAERAREAFAAHGYLETVKPTPIGPQPGKVTVQHVVNEMLVHGWDLARGLGVSSDIEPGIAANALASWKAFFAGYPRSMMGANFGEEQPAPDGASNADKVAAYLGRKVT